MLSVSQTGRTLPRKANILLQSSRATFATTASRDEKYKFVVVGGGAAGLSAANQIYDRYKAAGKALKSGDIAIVDASEHHHYQPGWTIVGAGLASKTDFRRTMDSLIPKHFAHVPEHVKSFSPKSSSIKTSTGRDIEYDALIVAAGLQINWNKIQGLPEALADRTSGVTSIYSYDTCDNVWSNIDGLQSGKAIFTQPFGVIKCPGAPQKIMWMAYDKFRRNKKLDKISVDFYNGMPTMFSVKKYSDALDAMRQKRSIGGHFQHELISVDAANRKATFKKSDGTTTSQDYSLLHVVPPMGALDLFKGSPIADKDGWVAVDPATLQHVNPEYSNVFALGDCSSLPTSRTAAAITAQAPVLTENLFSFMETGKVAHATYDGYTSCPLFTGYGELMLAEFKYGFVPKESFGHIVDQGKSRRVFYHLAKDIFPTAYFNYLVRGKWFGPRGFSRPSFPQEPVPQTSVA